MPEGPFAALWPLFSVYIIMKTAFSCKWWLTPRLLLRTGVYYNHVLSSVLEG